MPSHDWSKSYYPYTALPCPAFRACCPYVPTRGTLSTIYFGRWKHQPESISADFGFISSQTQRRYPRELSRFNESQPYLRTWDGRSTLDYQRSTTIYYLPSCPTFPLWLLSTYQADCSGDRKKDHTVIPRLT